MFDIENLKNVGKSRKLKNRTSSEKLSSKMQPLSEREGSPKIGPPVRVQDILLPNFTHQYCNLIHHQLSHLTYGGVTAMDVHGQDKKRP